jgi:hypothetical protein
LYQSRNAPLVMPDRKRPATNPNAARTLAVTTATDAGLGQALDNNSTFRATGVA